MAITITITLLGSGHSDNVSFHRWLISRCTLHLSNYSIRANNFSTAQEQCDARLITDNKNAQQQHAPPSPPPRLLWLTGQFLTTGQFFQTYSRLGWVSKSELLGPAVTLSILCYNQSQITCSTLSNYYSVCCSTMYAVSEMWRLQNKQCPSCSLFMLMYHLLLKYYNSGQILNFEIIR